MLGNSRLSIVFVTRKRNLEVGNIKIYVRVSVDGKRAEFSLNRELSVSLWDEKRKRGKGHSNYVISLNKYLDQVFTGLHEAHRQLLQEDVDITSKVESPVKVVLRHIWGNIYKLTNSLYCL